MNNGSYGGGSSVDEQKRINDVSLFDGIFKILSSFGLIGELQIFIRSKYIIK